MVDGVWLMVDEEPISMNHEPSTINHLSSRYLLACSRCTIPAEKSNSAAE
jgi:hypothetical protein